MSEPTGHRKKTLLRATAGLLLLSAFVPAMIVVYDAYQITQQGMQADHFTTKFIWCSLACAFLVVIAAIFAILGKPDEGAGAPPR